MTHRLALLVALPLAACSSEPTGARLLNPNVSRSPIVFESSSAERTFEKALNERYKDGDAYIERMQARLSKNAYFNHQVKIADLDGDGIITEAEAQEFATEN